MKDKLSYNTIDLGKAGESNNRRIVLEIPCCWEDVSSENVMFLLQLPKTTAAIPYDVEVDGHTAFINVDASMTKLGKGKAQLLQLRNDIDLDWVKEHWNQDINANDIVINSKMYETICNKSLNTREPIPEPQSTWLTKIIQAGISAQFIKELWEDGAFHKYIAGDNITITPTSEQGVDEISAHFEGQQLEPGQGINIEDNVISTTQDIDQMAEDLENKADKTTKINGHTLSADITITKSDLGLGNVDNTSDLNKPISNATQTALDNKVDKETGKGLSTNDYTTSEKTALSNLQSYTMSDTTSTNKNANMDFVNSSISSATAHYIKNPETGEEWESLSDLKDYTTEQTVSENDYAVVKTEVESKNDDAQYKYDRYKFTIGSTPYEDGWGREYTLHPGFTAAQWAALMSGVSANILSQMQSDIEGKVDKTTKVNGHALSDDVTVTKSDIGLGNVNNTSDADKPISDDTQDALNEKLDKETGTTTYDKAYVKLKNGTQSSMAITRDAYASSIVMRDANSRFAAATPIADGDVANKGYVDNAINNSHIVTGEYDDETGGTFEFDFTTKDTVS